VRSQRNSADAVKDTQAAAEPGRSRDSSALPEIVNAGDSWIAPPSRLAPYKGRPPACRASCPTRATPQLGNCLGVRGSLESDEPLDSLITAAPRVPQLETFHVSPDRVRRVVCPPYSRCHSVKIQAVGKSSGTVELFNGQSTSHVIDAGLLATEIVNQLLIPRRTRDLEALEADLKSVEVGTRSSARSSRSFPRTRPSATCTESGMHYRAETGLIDASWSTPLPPRWSTCRPWSSIPCRGRCQ
jgi:hypothetical protein